GWKMRADPDAQRGWSWKPPRAPGRHSPCRPYLLHTLRQLPRTRPACTEPWRARRRAPRRFPPDRNLRLGRSVVATLRVVRARLVEPWHADTDVGRRSAPGR